MTPRSRAWPRWRRPNGAERLECRHEPVVPPPVGTDQREGDGERHRLVADRVPQVRPRRPGVGTGVDGRDEQGHRQRERGVEERERAAELGLVAFDPAGHRPMSAPATPGGGDDHRAVVRSRPTHRPHPVPTPSSARGIMAPCRPSPSPGCRRAWGLCSARCSAASASPRRCPRGAGGRWPSSAWRSGTDCSPAPRPGAGSCAPGSWRIVWFAPSMLWMYDLTAPGYPVAVVVFAAYVGVAGIAVPGRATTSWVRWLAVPGAFTLAEAARWTFPFGGVPLATTAMSQAGAPLGQIARVRCAIGVVFFVGVGGVALSAAWERSWRWAGGRPRRRRAGLERSASSPPPATTSAQLEVAIVQGGGPSAPGPRTPTRGTSSSATSRPRETGRAAGRPRRVARERGRRRGPARRRAEEPASCRPWPAELDATLVVGVTEGIDADTFVNASIVYPPTAARATATTRCGGSPSASTCRSGASSRRVAGDGAGLPSRDAVRRHRARPWSTPRSGPWASSSRGRSSSPTGRRDAIAQRRRDPAQPDQRLVATGSPRSRPSRWRRAGCGPSRPGGGCCRRRRPGSAAIVDPTGRRARPHRHRRAGRAPGGRRPARGRHHRHRDRPAPGGGALGRAGGVGLVARQPSATSAIRRRARCRRDVREGCRTP